MSTTKKILVVDDDPYILMSLEFLMKKNGFDVMVARNGTEALEIVEKQVPDIVLLDIMMPDVDGYAICQEQGDRYTKRLRPRRLSLCYQTLQHPPVAQTGSGTDQLILPPLYKILVNWYRFVSTLRFRL